MKLDNRIVGHIYKASNISDNFWQALLYYNIVRSLHISSPKNWLHAWIPKSRSAQLTVQYAMSLGRRTHLMGL